MYTLWWLVKNFETDGGAWYLPLLPEHLVRCLTLEIMLTVEVKQEFGWLASTSLIFSLDDVASQNSNVFTLKTKIVKRCLTLLVNEDDVGGVGGAWVAQSVKHPTVSFGSGHELTVHGYQAPHGIHTLEPAWDSFSPSLTASPPVIVSFSLTTK